MAEPDPIDGDATDVVICGAGLAGLTLALQLRQEAPELRVALLDRMARPLPEGAHKVGESSVELGSQYLERLGLADYLRTRHIVKFGLRFFAGPGHLPLEHRAEYGPTDDPAIRSYQIDRGRFENDLRALVAERGVALLEGGTVREVDLGANGADHRIAYDRDGVRTSIRAHWVVDATGRTALLKRRLGLRRGSRLVGNAGWFRVQGRVDPADLVPDRAASWHDAPRAAERWRSTSHFMGAGYWVWLIPVAQGRTSVGVVTHDAVHGFERVRTLEAVMAFLDEHEPLLATRLRDAEVLDFRCLKGYSHTIARAWSVDRWAIVGEAGAFVDPLYSPGTDFIALANTFTAELVAADARGEAIDDRVLAFNAQYRAFVRTGIGLYERAAPVYGHSRAMAAKIYWDDFLYWAFVCQYFQQRLYCVTGPDADALQATAARYQDLSMHLQSLFTAWATRAPESRVAHAGFRGLPRIPSLPVDAHNDLQHTWTPAQTLAAMRRRLEEIEAVARDLVVRVLLEHGPDLGGAIVRDAGVASWGLGFDAEQAARDRARGSDDLDAVAQDVQRNLGQVDVHAGWSD